MLREVVLTHQVWVSVKSVDINKEILASYVVGRSLKQLSKDKACKHGYMLAVTKLIRIGRGENKLCPEHILFPVVFRCRVFIPVAGEVLTGVVQHVVMGGVFLKSGPMHMVYLSTRLMPNYLFVPGERTYVRDDSSKIGIGVVVRYSVYAVRWIEDKYREFRVLATIDADGLGPVALNGLDGIAS
ncbi:DNA-directed RNA polymerase subunit 7-like protein [Salvia hispanica]|uniref:DNA-directed RNA polymerase subunit 7-like protein n=1 Tax=Salvia hispanica TaxID=49212 RepID=UPI002009726F|nr:DNA-directed RNA polymerase subunit 7-like protein [Salvia hispanica]XP_047947898.1 DNA-directed RNA polymerase subunit 7-like protein [Salvia hispanica]